MVDPIEEEKYLKVIKRAKIGIPLLFILSLIFFFIDKELSYGFAGGAIVVLIFVTRSQKSHNIMYQPLNLILLFIWDTIRI